MPKSSTAAKKKATRLSINAGINAEKAKAEFNSTMKNMIELSVAEDGGELVQQLLEEAKVKGEVTEQDKGSSTSDSDDDSSLDEVSARPMDQVERILADNELTPIDKHPKHGRNLSPTTPTPKPKKLKNDATPKTEVTRIIVSQGEYDELLELKKEKDEALAKNTNVVIVTELKPGEKRAPKRRSKQDEMAGNVVKPRLKRQRT